MQEVSACTHLCFHQTKKTAFRLSHSFGGDKRDRTADLLNAIQALSQLSYTPMRFTIRFCAGGLSPASKMDNTRNDCKCQALFQISFVFKKIIPASMPASLLRLSFLCPALFYMRTFQVPNYESVPNIKNRTPWASGFFINKGIGLFWHRRCLPLPEAFRGR